MAMTLEERQDKARKYGANLAKQHKGEDKGHPPLDKILELVGATNLEENEKESIFEWFEDGYYDEKFRIKYNG